MKIKIGTFGFVLKNPKFDKDRMTLDLVNSGFEKKYYKLGLMKAYRPDGTEIPNKEQISYYSNQYQLKGKLFSIAFTGEDVLVHHQFGQNTSEINYDLAEYVKELRLFLNYLMNFLSFELKGFELMLLLRGIGTKNPKDIQNLPTRIQIGLKNIIINNIYVEMISIEKIRYSILEAYDLPRTLDLKSSLDAIASKIQEIIKKENT